MNKQLFACLAAFLPVLAHADLDIFVCEPEWGALADEIGGAHVETTSATNAFQDPHYIQARPSLIAGVRNADLVICSGAQLEIGWLPVLLRKANNRDVMPGANGYFEASSFVVRLGATANVDRAQGDVHPQGNPHVQTNPHNVPIIAKALAQRMGELDPVNSAAYASGAADFSERWTAAMARWDAKGAPLQGRRVITHHKSWIYLERWLGLEEVANLEPIPGVPPTIAHLSGLVSQFEDGGADFIIRASYQDKKPSEWLSQRTGIPSVMLPLTVGGSDKAIDLFALYDDMLDRLLAAVES